MLPTGAVATNPDLHDQKWPLFLASIVAFLLLVVTFVFEAPQKLSVPENYDINKPEVVSQRLKQISVLTPEEYEATRKGFEERDWPKALSATDDFGKSEPYRNLYGGLGARYNVTKDPAVKAEMDKIEQFIAKTWPVLYQALVDGGAFRR